MTPRLSGQTSIFGVVFFVPKSLLGIEGQRKLEKFAIFTRKPRSHARILIYRTWPIINVLMSHLYLCAYENQPSQKCVYSCLEKVCLKYKRGKAYATMSKVIMGNGGFYGCLSKPWWKETAQTFIRFFSFLVAESP